MTILFGAFTSTQKVENVGSLKKKRKSRDNHIVWCIYIYTEGRERWSPKKEIAGQSSKYHKERSLLKVFSKSILNAFFAEHEFSEKQKVWPSESLFSLVTDIKDIGDVVWFSKPEYHYSTLGYIFSFLDVDRLTTNCRAKVCRDGFPERGIENKAQISATRENETRLKVSHAMLKT